MSNNIPQDSVLRRHYEAAQSMNTQNSSTASPGSATMSTAEIKPKLAEAPAQRPSPAPAPSHSHDHSHSSHSHSHEEDHRGGIFGWLKRLLGG